MSREEEGGGEEMTALVRGTLSRSNGGNVRNLDAKIYKY